MKQSDILQDVIARGMAKYKANEGKGSDPMSNWDAETKFVLGFVDLSDVKPGDSPDFAIHLIEQSAEAGFMLAQFILGNCYEEGGFGKVRDKSKAEYWWGKAAEQGLDDAKDKISFYGGTVASEPSHKELDLEAVKRLAPTFKDCISAGNSHTVGLKSDGTVVAVGENEDGQCNTHSWQNIKAISAGACHTLGLRVDGTVIATGKNDSNQCDVHAGIALSPLLLVIFTHLV